MAEENWKVQIITHTKKEDLQKDINQFLSGIPADKMVDIKYIQNSVLVIYKK